MLIVYMYQIFEAMTDDIENAGYGKKDKTRSATTLFLKSVSGCYVSFAHATAYVTEVELPKRMQELYKKFSGMNFEKDKKGQELTKDAIDTVCKKCIDPKIDEIYKTVSDFVFKVLVEQNKPTRKFWGHISKFSNKDAIDDLKRVLVALKEIEEGMRDYFYRYGSTVLNDRGISYNPQPIYTTGKGKPSAQFTELDKVLKDSNIKEPFGRLLKGINAILVDIQNAGYGKKDKTRSATKLFFNSLSFCYFNFVKSLNYLEKGELEKHINDAGITSSPAALPAELLKGSTEEKIVKECYKSYIEPKIKKIGKAVSDFKAVLSKQSRFPRKFLGHTSKFANKESIAALGKLSEILENSEDAGCKYLYQML